MRLIAAKIGRRLFCHGHVSPATAGAGLENTTNMARGHHACTAIMGLDRLDWLYRSLKDSLQHRTKPDWFRRA